jgi:hypothetical protein
MNPGVRRTMPDMPMWVPSFLTSESEDEDELPLREFIYLDEVSVVSLLASLTREVTEARTDIDMTENRKRWRFRLKAALSHLPVVGGGSASRETVSVDRDTEEVVRRSQIESKFDELYAETSPHLQLTEKDTKSGVSVSNLSKGGLLEVDVEFSGHELFHYYKAFQYLIDVAEDAEYEFDNQEKQAIELMGSLFGDQIPVVGELENYVLVDGAIQEKDENGDREDAESLWIAGTLDPEMLWQEPIQFLYEENEFTAYVRVSEAQIQKDWDPIKLTRVIKSISKPIGNQLSSVIDAAFSQAKEEFDTAELEEDAPDDIVREHHNEYFDYIEEDGNLSLSSDRREELLVTAYSETTIQPDESNFELETRLLRELTQVVEDEADVNLDRDTLAQRRSRIINNEEGVADSDSDTSNRNYLEVSFVAVYW